MQRVWIALGSLAGLTAVAMAALAAHGMGWLDPAALAMVRSAIEMQGWHALALLACGLWVAEWRKAGRLGRRSLRGRDGAVLRRGLCACTEWGPTGHHRAAGWHAADGGMAAARTIGDNHNTDCEPDLATVPCHCEKRSGEAIPINLPGWRSPRRFAPRNDSCPVTWLLSRMHRLADAAPRMVILGDQHINGRHNEQREQRADRQPGSNHQSHVEAGDRTRTCRHD